jgi:hypothetical protein
VSVFRTASVWVTAFLLAIVLTAFLGAVTMTQLTADDTGKRVLRRSVATTTGLDASLPQIEAALREAAVRSPEAMVQVPDFPIPVLIPREEAMTLSGPALRDRILQESAEALHDSGMSAWAAADPNANQSPERASTAGLMKEGFGLISSSTHNFFLVVAILLGVIVLGMAGILVIALPWDARLPAMGIVGLLASLPPLAAAVGVRFAFRTAETDGDPFLDGLMNLGADSMWVPIRNYFTLTALSFAVLIVGSLLLWWEARNVRIQGHPADTGT